MTSIASHPSAESMNTALQRLYDSYLPEIHSLIEKCGLATGGDVSQIFTMHIDEHYAQASHKILFAGRETFGWFNYERNSVAAELMKNYSDFSNSDKYPNSPFWRFRRELSQRFGIDESDFRNATLWTNLSKIDVEKAKPQGERDKLDCLNHLIQLFIKLLVAEIDIVKPDVVVIMTTDGFYNWHLNYYNWQENKSYFESDHAVRLKREPLNGVKIDKLTGDVSLPAHTYQMCHPRALLSKGGSKANQFIEAIYRSVTVTVTSEEV